MTKQETIDLLSVTTDDKSPHDCSQCAHDHISRKTVIAIAQWLIAYGDGDSMAIEALEDLIRIVKDLTSKEDAVQKILPKGMYGQIRCSKCGGAVFRPDKFCRWCGKSFREPKKTDYLIIPSEK